MVDRDRILTALGDATLASSVHNCQPWRFRIGDGTVDVVLDASATPRAVDPQGRWALASIGAVVANLELALTSRTGLSTSTTYFPDGDEPTPGETAGGQAYDGRTIARVELGEAATTASALRAARLAGAMVERHTTRGPLLGGPPSSQEWVDLRSAVASAPRMNADVAPAALVRVLLAATAQAEAARQDEPDYPEEIQGWVENAAAAGTGIPRAAIGVPDADGRVPIRDFTLTPLGASGAGDAAFFEDPPALLVLSADTDTPGDQVAGGHALQQAMLEAAALGLGVGVLGQALEEADSRAAVSDAVSQVVGRDVVVHQVLRLGHPLGQLVSPTTPRRPVAELLLA